MRVRVYVCVFARVYEGEGGEERREEEGRAERARASKRE